MEFKEKLYELIERINSLKDEANTQTEQGTKTSMVMPFFQLLGYDVFNTLEFVPEFTADVGVKKGEKVDYAIIIDNAPTILVECKPCHDNLEKHASQLFRYFTTTSARFGILTNGILYKFFTDLEVKNIMDEKPFLTVNLLDLKDRDIAELSKFAKGSLDVDNILSSAEDLKYGRLIKEWFSEQIDSPTIDFVKFVLNYIYDGVKTQKILDEFTPIVKKSLQQYINDSMNAKIKSALSKDSDNDNILKPTTDTESISEDSSEPSTHESKIVTTIEELEAYAVIKSILRTHVDSDRIAYRDTESYFGVLLDNNNKKWICRIYLMASVKYITIPDTNKSDLLESKKRPVRHDIENIDDIYKFSDEIIASCKRYV